MSEESAAEKLMNALISKMESMDNTIHSLKAENKVIKQHISNPTGLLKKMGFISVKTPFAEGVMPDVFRGGPDDILKDESSIGSSLSFTNEEIHSMDWNDIHELAETAKDSGNVGNAALME